MKAYLAARYDRRDELREYAEKLRKELHFNITSRWLEESLPLTINLNDVSDEVNALSAEIDLADVSDADCLIFFSEDPTEGFKRGGRHVEFGIALAQNKPIYIIGPKENIFHYYNPQQIGVFNSLDQFIFDYKKVMKLMLRNVKNQLGEERAFLLRKKIGLEWLPELTDEEAMELDGTNRDELNPASYL